jgi:hypothetical protein
VYRHNVFKDTCQGNSFDATATSCTAILGWYGNGPGSESFSNSKVYGNLFWDTVGTVFYSDAAIWMGGDRSAQFGGAYVDDCSNCDIVNNTFVGLGKRTVGQVAFKYIGAKSGSRAHNNIWHDFGSSSTGCQAASCSNNVAVTSASVFVNTAAGNFRLSADGAAGAGVALASPYNVDMTGAVRGSGTWDVGAYEYNGGAPVTALAPPANLQVR